MVNTSFVGFSAAPHCQDHLQAVGRFLDSGELAAIFARLDPLDFDIQRILHSKVQVTPHANLEALRPSINEEWDHETTE
jgi:hypothetical protein